MSTFLWDLRAAMYLDNQDHPIYISAAVCTSADNAKTIAEKYAQTPLSWSFDDDDCPLWEAPGHDLPISISYGDIMARVAYWTIWGYKLDEEFSGDWGVVPLEVAPTG